MADKRSTFAVNMKTDEYDVRIDRKSDWGNPFPVHMFGRGPCIKKYEQWFVNQPHLVRRLPELTGKRLGCHCHPQDCHGDFLSKLSNFHDDVLKIMVTGSRSITDKHSIRNAIDTVRPLVERGGYKEVIFFHGAARGVDRIAGEYADELGWRVVPVPADWDGLGKSAGYVRNDIMMKLSQWVIAIYDGESRGTKHVLDNIKRYDNITDTFFTLVDPDSP